jgi:hypothetical protein
VLERRTTGHPLLDTLSQSLDDLLKGHELKVEEPRSGQALTTVSASPLRPLCSVCHVMSLAILACLQRPDSCLDVASSRGGPLLQGNYFTWYMLCPWGLLNASYQNVIFTCPSFEVCLQLQESAEVLCRVDVSAVADQSFDLTGKTGSYFYMAPEVISEQHYNEKASSHLCRAACKAMHHHVCSFQFSGRASSNDGPS